MVLLEPFAVEQYMNEHELTAKYNISESCCASISVDQLAALSEKKDAQVIDLSRKMLYGAIPGSKELRANLARLYSSKVGTPLPEDNILITPGAIAANYLVFYSLVGPGDHVICHHPTYQQLYSVPASFGAKVDLWKARPEDDWVPDIEELKKLVRPDTKLIIINNPNNPTGAVLNKSLLQKIIDLAEEHGITILSDEVYRPLFHSIGPMDAEFPPSILSMGYKNVIATGSLSKAYSLAGIRVGWIASRNPELVEKFWQARDYSVISVSGIDDQVAAFALGPDTVHSLLARNLALAKKNLAALEKFMIKYDDECEWVKPKAGTTAFIKFKRDGKAVDATDFCEKLQAKTGAMLVPGDFCFGEEFKGYVRLGYVQEEDVLKEGLEALKQFLKKDFDDVKLAE
ncbi:MAG: hypothetical protein M1820_006681 [Bogoriella megaspora]|nr:MAG: hypothetical protein M1820_006681 [Bogoriella megaspora]